MGIDDIGSLSISSNDVVSFAPPSFPFFLLLSFHYSVRTDTSGIEIIRDILRILIEHGRADVNPIIRRAGQTTPLTAWLFSLQVILSRVTRG